MRGLGDLRVSRGLSGFTPQTDAIQRRTFHHGVMSAATFIPASASGRPGPPPGATGLDDHHHRHRLADALRAVKVFASAAFGVIVLGEYAEEAGIRRR
jgi:hypothetical protein